MYGAGHADALLRRRYDGAPFLAVVVRQWVSSLDLKILAELMLGQQGRRHAPPSRAPLGVKTSLCARPFANCVNRGETVVCVLPGHEHEVQEFGAIASWRSSMDGGVNWFEAGR